MKKCYIHLHFLFFHFLLDFPNSLNIFLPFDTWNSINTCSTWAWVTDFIKYINLRTVHWKQICVLRRWAIFFGHSWSTFHYFHPLFAPRDWNIWAPRIELFALQFQVRKLVSGYLFPRFLLLKTNSVLLPKVTALVRTHSPQSHCVFRFSHSLPVTLSRKVASVNSYMSWGYNSVVHFLAWCTFHCGFSNIFTEQIT